MGNGKTLSARQRRALATFEDLEEVHLFDMFGIGITTMDQLVIMGLIEVLDKTVGRNSKNLRWKRTSIPIPAGVLATRPV